MFKHCKEENLSYFEHMKQALKYYVIIQKSAIAVLIHALFPCFFTKYASDEIKNLSEHFAQK
jgi:hypothetical protein